MRWRAIATVFLVTMRVASADPAADKLAADKLFREGRALLKANKLEEACAAFERSDRLEPRVKTILNLADCREREGRTATAWALFLEAKARAAPTNARRELTPEHAQIAESAATTRVTSLESKLSYQTLKVDREIDGLVIKRAGAVVPPTVWNKAVPLDPADYEIEASAPGYKPWSTTQPLRPRDRATITIGPLVAEVAEAGVVAPDPKPIEVAIQPAEPEPAPESDITQPALAASDPVPARRLFAIGLALGVAAGHTSSAPPSNEDVLEDDHMPIGVRILGSLPVPYGAVRAIGSMLYTKGLNDETDSTNTKKLFVIGLGADYVWMPLPQIGFAIGLGLGWDYEVRSQDQGTDTAQWTTLRASPFIYRFMNGHVELGAHLQLIRRGDETGFIGVAAIDVFPR